MTEQVTIIGTPVSPYVRKVLAILDMKGIPFRCVPQIPFLGDAAFTRLSPLRRIPVLVQGDFSLPDSTAIVQYLEELAPHAPAYPGDAQTRARARWFEEYADDHLGRNVVFNLFVQRVVRPRILKEETDEALVNAALTEGLPNALDYLDGVLGGDGFIVGDLSIADIMIGAIMKNAFWAGWEMDAARWPKFAAYLGRVHAVPSLARVNALADEIMTAHPKEHAAIIERFHAA